MVKFMYHGIVNVSSDKLPGVLKVNTKNLQSFFFIRRNAYYFVFFLVKISHKNKTEHIKPIIAFSLNEREGREGEPKFCINI